jgi:mannan polymerase II complex MNN11 subunit
MQFALPPRRAQHAAPSYVARQQRAPLARRVGPKQVVLIVFSFFILLFFLGKLSASSDGVPAGTPSVVLVTTFDDTDQGDHDLQDVVKRNRWDYAAKHGYATFFGNYTDYEQYLEEAPKSWAKVPSIRHAMTEFPYSTFFWFLDEHSLIMNLDVDFEQQVGGKVTLERNMMVDVPVVPPDSVIHTFANLDGNHIDLIVSQDSQGLSTGSFVVRAGDWAKFFLDAWFDPLYRSYNFQKAETHALEHIVQ